MTSAIGAFLQSDRAHALMAQVTRDAAIENARFGLPVPVPIDGAWVARHRDGSLGPLGQVTPPSTWLGGRFRGRRR